MNLTILAIPFFLTCLIIEIGFSIYKKTGFYEPKDTATSLTMGIVSIFTSALAASLTIGAHLFLYENRLFELEASLSIWLYWVLLMFGQDFCYYWSHRGGHRVRILWAAHVNHHSSQFYNLSTALRQSWTGGFMTFIFYLPLTYLGFSPIDLALMGGINLIYQFWIHTEAIDKLPRWFEWIFNTPSHHRVHHGVNSNYIDKNYAGIFIIWDRLFNSFQAENEKPRFGLVTNIETFNPLKVAFHSWLSMFASIASEKRWGRKILIPFMPPDWLTQLEIETKGELHRESLRQD